MIAQPLLYTRCVLWWWWFEAKYVNVDGCCCVCGGGKLFRYRIRRMFTKQNSNEWNSVWKCQYTCACQCLLQILPLIIFHKFSHSDALLQQCKIHVLEFTFQSSMSCTHNWNEIGCDVRISAVWSEVMWSFCFDSTLWTGSTAAVHFV